MIFQGDMYFKDLSYRQGKGSNLPGCILHMVHHTAAKLGHYQCLYRENKVWGVRQPQVSPDNTCTKRDHLDLQERTGIEN